MAAVTSSIMFMSGNTNAHHYTFREPFLESFIDIGPVVSPYQRTHTDTQTHRQTHIQAHRQIDNLVLSDPINPNTFSQ